MPHNLYVDPATNQAAMMYYGNTPWHGLGKKLDSPATAAEAIRRDLVGSLQRDH